MARVEDIIELPVVHVLELKAFQDAWGEWADKTFPKSDLDSITSHFREEAKEFAGGSQFQNPTGEAYSGKLVFIPPSHDPEEAADCLLLLLHHAHKAGYNLMAEAMNKASINVQRDWDIDDDGGHGHFKHK